MSSSENNERKFSVWCVLSILSFLGGAFCFYKGIDKMVNYCNSEYSYIEPVNAYVGGDAYNYIINGTYSTAFFVLTAMFVLTGVGFIIIHYLSRRNTPAIIYHTGNGDKSLPEDTHKKVQIE